MVSAWSGFTVAIPSVVASDGSQAEAIAVRLFSQPKLQHTQTSELRAITLVDEHAYEVLITGIAYR